MAETKSQESKSNGERMPALFIAHGGGPSFFMEDMPMMGPKSQMCKFFKGLAATLPTPKAIVVVSAHYESSGAIEVTGASSPGLLFDYYGFPPHTYELTYPAPGNPELASRIVTMLREKGIDAEKNNKRAFDHGVFIPLKVIYPEATIPVIDVSIRKGYDPKFHIALGEALAPLRDDGVLIIGSGMSFHSFKAFGNPNAYKTEAKEFNDWLTETVADESVDQEERSRRLTSWDKEAPHARFAHPTEEHFIPLHVAYGCGNRKPGKIIFNQAISNALPVSMYKFD